MGFIQRFQESLAQPIREIIGRVSSFSTYWTNRWRITPTIDRTAIDAAFWDRTRRGQTPGLEFSAPLLNPIYSKIAAWALGQAPQFTFENPNTQQSFDTWLEDNHAALLEVMEESLALGTPYLLINADLSVTILPPDTVEIIVDEADYSKIIGYRVTEVYPHPENTADVMRITDEYYADRRVVTTYHKGTPRVRTYSNLIGRLPILPIPNKRGVNETYGRPEVEALLTILYEYNDVMKYAIDGNKKQGRPTPVISKMGKSTAIDAFWSKYGKRYTYVDEHGREQQGIRLDFDSDQLLTLGDEAVFDWVSPASFMNDVSKLLELFFYIIVQHSELPEFIFGVSIASSKASADAQLPTFTKFIEKKQSLSRRWLLEVAEIVTGYLSLIERRVQPERPSIQFEPLTTSEGELTLKSIIWAYGNGLIDELTALSTMPLDIDDPLSVLKKAKEEAAARADAFDQQADAEIARQERLRADDETPTVDEDNGAPAEQTATERRTARLVA